MFAIIWTAHPAIVAAFDQFFFTVPADIWLAEKIVRDDEYRNTDDDPKVECHIAFFD